MKSFFCVLLMLVCINRGLSQNGFSFAHNGQVVSAEEIKRLLPDTFDLFGEDTPLELEIVSDFRHLIEQKLETEYQEATLTLKMDDGIMVRGPIQLRARGNSRLEICRLPPLKLNFSDTHFAIEGLRELEKIKMVSYCNKGNAFEQYLFREYLIYRIYSLFTPFSFRTRLVKMTYVDSGKNNKKYEGYAFLIEEIDRLERRLDAVESKRKKVHPDSTVYEHVNLFSTFQFMIGNHDWSIPSLHNVKILSRQEDGRTVLYCIPYDFDYSGLVDAHYAVPSRRLNLQSVKDRIFRGFCRTEEEFNVTFDLFHDKKPEIYGLIESFPYLSRYDRKDMLSYLDSFYEIISTDAAIQRHFLDNCR